MYKSILANRFFSLQCCCKGTLCATRRRKIAQNGYQLLLAKGKQSVKTWRIRCGEGFRWHAEMMATWTFLTDLCEAKDFASQACTLVNLCCDAGFTIAYKLGSVLNGTADLVPRLRLVQIHDQEGELRSRDIQRRHLFQQQDSDLLQRAPISLKYEDTLTKEKRGE